MYVYICVCVYVSSCCAAPSRLVSEGKPCDSLKGGCSPGDMGIGPSPFPSCSLIMGLRCVYVYRCECAWSLYWARFSHILSLAMLHRLS